MLGCSSGHRFDINRRGFVALLRGRSAVTGDSAPMLDARETVLESGAYRPVADAVDAALPRGRSGRLIDVATGTGHYLEVALRSRPGWYGLALDRSPAAVARATRRDMSEAASYSHGTVAADASAPLSVDGLVADVWSEWPVRDGAADTLLGVFAPRNPAEFHRVLSPGGTLVVAVPGGDHLTELHEAGLGLSVDGDKATSLVDDLWTWFEHDQSRTVRYRLPTGEGVVRALVGMGPAAHHSPDLDRARDVDAVTVDVTVLRFRRRRRALD